MKFRQFVTAFGAPLVAVVPLLAIATPSNAAEETVLLCEGATRITARIYQTNGALKMRLFDRKTNAIWFNSAAKRETNPEIVTYSNLRGEQSIYISSNRNDSTICSIQVGGKPLERGTVLTP